MLYYGYDMVQSVSPAGPVFEVKTVERVVFRMNIFFI